MFSSGIPKWLCVPGVICWQTRIQDFLKGGSRHSQAPPPPLDIVRVASSALQKMRNTPTLGHSQAPPPWTLCPRDVIRPPENWKIHPCTVAHISQAPPLVGHCPCDVIHIYFKSLLKKRKLVVESRGGHDPPPLDPRLVDWFLALLHLFSPRTLPVSYTAVTDHADPLRRWRTACTGSDYSLVNRRHSFIVRVYLLY